MLLQRPSAYELNLVSTEAGRRALDDQCQLPAKNASIDSVKKVK